MEEFYGSGIVKEEQIQMEIRLLYGNEIQWAVQTAHEVYEQCVRPYTRNAAEVQQYYDYMNLPNLSQEMLAGGRVFLSPPPPSTEYLPLTFPPVEKSACGVGLRRPF